MKKIIRVYLIVLMLESCIFGWLSITNKNIYLYLSLCLSIIHLIYQIVNYIYTVRCNKNYISQIKEKLNKDRMELQIKGSIINILNIENICDLLDTYNFKNNEIIEIVKTKGRDKNRIIFSFGYIPVIASYIIYLFLTFHKGSILIILINLAQVIISVVYLYIITEYYSKVILKKIAEINRKTKR